MELGLREKDQEQAEVSAEAAVGDVWVEPDLALDRAVTAFVLPADM